MAGPAQGEVVRVDVATMDEIVRVSMFQRRLMLQMIGTFGFLALILASVGIARVVSHTMNSRLREIGILVALGARQILGLAITATTDSAERSDAVRTLRYVTARREW